jgi:hypothetical protein
MLLGKSPGVFPHWHSLTIYSRKRSPGASTVALRAGIEEDVSAWREVSIDTKPEALNLRTDHLKRVF